MSRQEDFEKQSEKYSIGCDEDDDRIYAELHYERGCEYGYQYAQTHPNWISVEDELPEPHFKDTSSKWVLVCVNQSHVYIDSYNHTHKEWCNNGKSVTHWMHLPTPPGKEATNESA